MTGEISGARTVQAQADFIKSHGLGSLLSNNDPLAALNIETHQLALLHVVSELLNSAVEAQNQEGHRYEPLMLLHYTQQLLLCCTMEHLSFVDIRFVDALCDRICKVASHTLGSPKLALRSLYELGCRWMPGCPLTIVAPHLFKMSLLAKNYKYALLILKEPIQPVQKDRHIIKAQDFLLYSYYGAMICIAVEKYEKAYELLLQCVCAPAHAASWIQIEALRKLTLVSLIVSGQQPNLPKFVSPALLRAFKETSGCYNDYAMAASSYQLSRALSEVKKHKEVFESHQHYGLVMKTILAIIRISIVRLTQTYLTLSLSDMSTSVGLDEEGLDLPVQDAEKIITHMVYKDQVYAKISEKDSMMVFFLDRVQNSVNVDYFGSSQQVLLGTQRQLEKTNQEIALHPEYLKRLASQKMQI